MKMEHPEYTVRQMSLWVKAKREEKSRSAEVNGFLEMFSRVRERKRERESLNAREIFPASSCAPPPPWSLSPTPPSVSCRPRSTVSFPLGVVRPPSLAC